MAIINISFDTNTKECSITKDGAEIEDVTYLSIDKYDDTAYLSISTEPKEQDGMREITRIVADNKEALNKSVAKLL